MRDRPRIEHLRRACEGSILVRAGLAAGAIGAVDAWAQLVLDVGLVLLAILGTLTGTRSDWRRRLFCVPSLALGGLALLALVQAVPLPSGVLKVIAPATSSFREGLAPV